MKRFKTWKRWAHFNKVNQEIFGNCYDRQFAEQVALRAIRESDYHKVMAVYNAAMKYEKTPTFLACKALQKACARARK